LRTVTFSDPAVSAALAERYVLYWENQVPGLYAKAPPETSFPREMVEGCPEGAGGNNVRHFICDPDGRVTAYFTGFWKAPRFLRELGPHGHDEDATGTSLERAQKNLLLRNHEETKEYAGRPVDEVLRQVRDEVYTKGKAG